MAKTFLEHFLALPAELRLPIYDALFAQPDLDPFDTTHIMTYDANIKRTQTQPASFSIILAHPKIFSEAYDLVLRTHPIMFEELGDLRRSVKYSYHHIRDTVSLILDFGVRVKPKVLRRALEAVADLPNLQRIEIRMDYEGLAHCQDLSLSTNWEFPALSEVIVRNLELERREARILEQERELGECLKVPSTRAGHRRHYVRVDNKKLLLQINGRVKRELQQRGQDTEEGMLTDMFG